MADPEDTKSTYTRRICYVCFYEWNEIPPCMSGDEPCPKCGWRKSVDGGESPCIGERDRDKAERDDG